jgi:hypothetical protein
VQSLGSTVCSRTDEALVDEAPDPSFGHFLGIPRYHISLVIYLGVAFVVLRDTLP